METPWCYLESQGRWELESSGQAWSGQVGACKTEATAAEHMWRDGWALLGPWLCQTYPLRPNSRTVKDLDFLLMLFQNQTEIGPCSWRFARISAWAQGLPGYSRGVRRPFSHLPHHSCWCVCFENGGRISMCFPRISCSFLEALVPSPPYAVTSGLFQLRSLLVVY